ncbi:MAG TPA: guanylate kinase [Chitinophagales bacterium]|nr:guanylate kinase [Chitinophagales bacterium]HMU97579.1 guanylate kinase [Chitinophagales bacterium]HMV02462.1 guanylate kinase [Chitinophagales bacterium]HMW93638.1 guanylate kinase [Chitinophagales bacterium]HMY41664.1 guanylate kinase [Chitinophagales bacterium]
MEKAIILSGPSGVGKNTLGDFLLARFPQLAYSVSATTRKIRTGEKEGKDYYYISVPEFENKIQNNELLEWQEVYEETYYGTLKSELDRIHQHQQVPLLVIDVYGAINVMKNIEIETLTIFIDIVSLEELEKRLTQRGTETAEKVAKRMEKAVVEVQEKSAFDVVIVNNDLITAQNELATVVAQFIGAEYSDLKL